MEQIKKPTFDELVKSEIQDKDESLSNILDIWGKDPVPLTHTYTLITKDQNTNIGLKYDPHYELSDDIKTKIKHLFDSDKWA